VNRSAEISLNKQEVLERTNLPTFLTLFKMSLALKPAFAPT
jgi:hypothetical protein